MKSLKEVFDDFFKGKPKLKIEIQKLYYLLVQSKDRYQIVLEPVPYPSTYQVMVGIQNLSKRRTSIKVVRLAINNQDIPCVNQSGVEFGPDEFKPLLWLFPVDYRLGQKSGHFVLTVVDTFNNVFTRSGRFPVGTRIQTTLYEKD
jgi:hypothetical protein